MQLDKLEKRQYDEMSELINRYFELYQKSGNEAFIFSVRVNINFGLQDINKIINKFNAGKLQIGDYYELIVKAYQILNAFDELSSEFKLLKSGYDELYGEEDIDDNLRDKERQKIDYFRALRSLTTAHSLKTTDKKFAKFGINNETWLEDVRIKKDIGRAFQNHDGDFVLDIRTKKEGTNNKLGKTKNIDVYIEKDILAVVRLILSKIKKLNTKLTNDISEKVKEYKNSSLNLPNNIDEKWIRVLREEVLKRYPKEIETGTYDNGKKFEYWCIKDLFDFVNWIPDFGDSRDDKIDLLKKNKKKLLFEYVEKIESMSLDLTYDFSLENSIDKEFDSYADEKITLYLARNTNVPKQKLIRYWYENYNRASNSSEVSNEIWGAVQLMSLEDSLRDYFILDWTKTYRELYWQYLTALFIKQSKKGD